MDWIAFVFRPSKAKDGFASGRDGGVTSSQHRTRSEAESAARDKLRKLPDGWVGWAADPFDSGRCYRVEKPSIPD